MMTLTLAMVAATVPKARAGQAMGLLGTMSAFGTTLGPALGGVLIAGLGWPAIFLINVPIGMVNFYLARRYLPTDRPVASNNRAGFDAIGTVLLAFALAAYALAMTTGHPFGPRSLALLSVSIFGVILFVFAQARVASPLVQLAMFRQATLRAGLAMNVLVATVMMTTLVVGPFYLMRGLGLDAARSGLVMAVGPLVAALSGIPAGRIVDRLGTNRTTIFGLAGMAAGLLTMTIVPELFGVAGYITAIVVVTASYALFQAANTTAVMTGVHPDQRGVVSGMLNLSRNIGLITGASAMGAVFAFAAAAKNIAAAPPQAANAGMRATFGLAALLMVAALTIAVNGRGRTAQSGRRP
jgi:MFS family permease